MEKGKLKILIVEDESSLADILEMSLSDFSILLFNCGDKAFQYILNNQNPPDLCLLDWMLPGHSGIELCRLIRTKPNWKSVPILMLTAKSRSEDIIEGLEAGADDYVTKPFDLKVLSARVKALLRRKNSQDISQNTSQIILDQIKIDTNFHGVWKGEEELSLTPSEFSILFSMLKNQNKVLTRKFLLDTLVEEDIHVTERVVDTHVYSLRKKLQEASSMIETIRGVGYRLCGSRHEK